MSWTTEIKMMVQLSHVIIRLHLTLRALRTRGGEAS